MHDLRGLNKIESEFLLAINESIEHVSNYSYRTQSLVCINLIGSRTSKASDVVSDTIGVSSLM